MPPATYKPDESVTTTENSIKIAEELVGDKMLVVPAPSKEPTLITFNIHAGFVGATYEWQPWIWQLSSIPAEDRQQWHPGYPIGGCTQSYVLMYLKSRAPSDTLA